MTCDVCGRVVVMPMDQKQPAYPWPCSDLCRQAIVAAMNTEKQRKGGGSDGSIGVVQARLRLRGLY